MRIPFSAALTLAQKRNLSILPTVAVAIVEALRSAGYSGTLPRSVRNPDLPSGILVRACCLEGRPESLVEAPEAQVRRCFCCLEAGISGAWCAALPPTDRRRRVYRRIVAVQHLVGSSRERRREALARWNAGAESKEST